MRSSFLTVILALAAFIMSVSAETPKCIESESYDTLAKRCDQNEFVSDRSYFYEAYKRAGRFTRKDILMDLYKGSEGKKLGEDSHSHNSDGVGHKRGEVGDRLPSGSSDGLGHKRGRVGNELPSGTLKVSTMIPLLCFYAMIRPQNEFNIGSVPTIGSFYFILKIQLLTFHWKLHALVPEISVAACQKSGHLKCGEILAGGFEHFEQIPGSLFEASLSSSISWLSWILVDILPEILVFGLAAPDIGVAASLPTGTLDNVNCEKILAVKTSDNEPELPTYSKHQVAVSARNATTRPIKKQKK
ncbi:hypothetical protein EDB19DRAFT_2028468 [Suillus lakei]|nr:hypothetical protein EDB19DRAFT_2028468 [Suillus lakei]